MDVPAQIGQRVEELRQERIARLKLVKENPHEVVPDEEHEFATELGELQAALDLPRDRFLSLPWVTLASLVGPIRPNGIIGVAAYTGAGKTVWLVNFVDRLLQLGKRVCVVSLEQSVGDYRLLLAATNIGLPHHRAYVDTLKPFDYQRVIEAAQESKGRLFFAPITTLTAKTIMQLYAYADARSADCIVVDHIHASTSTDFQSYHNIMAALRAAANRYVTPCILAMQCRRGEAAPLARYEPPRTTDIQGGEVIPQYCDIALGLYWPLQSGSEPMIRKREVTAIERVKVNRLGVVVMKHRWDGGQTGRTIELMYQHGLLSDLPIDRRENDQ